MVWCGQMFSLLLIAYHRQQVHRRSLLADYSDDIPRLGLGMIIMLLMTVTLGELVKHKQPMVSVAQLARTQIWKGNICGYIWRTSCSGNV